MLDTKPEDILSEVVISISAAYRWQSKAAEFAQEISQQGRLKMSVIPDEKAKLEADGSLTVYATIADLVISMRVEPDEWCYKS